MHAFSWLSSAAAFKQNFIILVAGKGHETYQIIGNDKFHFDDRAIARWALEKLKEIAES